MTAVITILENLNKLSQKFQSLTSILVLICIVVYVASGWSSFTNRVERSLERLETSVTEIRQDITEIRQDIKEIRQDIRSLDVRVSKLEVKVDDLDNHRKNP